MNLKNAENYIVGLDIGTGSVGWAVVDEDGDLYKFHGRNTLGSRLFDSASTAADTRTKRTLRRRYGRRYRRIQTLRSFMLPDIANVDPDFFCRLNQSDLVASDKDFPETGFFFSGGELTDSEYYHNYRTIYHLREHLVNSTEKEDIRLVYLALHHMMKYRGNFLIEGAVSAKDANADEAITTLLDEIEAWCDFQDIDYEKSTADSAALAKAIEASSEYRRDRQASFSDALGLPPTAKKAAKALGQAAFGYETNFGQLFGIEESADTKFSLAKDDKVEKFEAEFLPDECAGLFASLKAVYSAYLLAGILSNAHGGTISSAMVARYEAHKADLAQLKRLIKTYFPKDENGTNKTYNEIFRGSRYADGLPVCRRNLQEKLRQGIYGIYHGQQIPRGFL